MYKFIFLIIGLLTSYFAPAQSVDFDKNTFLEEYGAAQENLKTLECRFKQVKSSELFKENEVSRGVLYVQSKQAARWEYVFPQKKVIVINGNHILTQEEGQKIEKYNFFDNPFVGKGIKLFEDAMNGQLLNSKHFRVEATPLSRDFVQVTLVPTVAQLKKYISTMVIKIAVDSFVMNQLTINEVSGDVTNVYFESVKLNEEINPQLFTLTP